MRHVIIEGPDGAGKTHLARELCYRFTMGYHHEGPPPPGASALEHYARLLATASRPTVFDRLHLGELVYGPLLRGACGLTPYDLTLLNRLVRGTGTIIIGCLPAWDTCLTNNRHKDELIKDERTLHGAYQGWATILRASSTAFVNGWVHDYQHANPPAELPATDRLPDGVIGDPRARLLLVGEQANGSLDLPFFSAKGSSCYLNNALADAGVPERDLALTNALDTRGQARDLPFIVSQMPNLRLVVALGHTAQGQVERQGLPPFVASVNLPHPQYWKRFKSKLEQAYVSMLKEAYAYAVA